MLPCERVKHRSALWVAAVSVVTVLTGLLLRAEAQTATKAAVPALPAVSISWDQVLSESKSTPSSSW